jgi:hypothetical protein
LDISITKIFISLSVESYLTVLEKPSHKIQALGPLPKKGYGRGFLTNGEPGGQGQIGQVSIPKIGRLADAAPDFPCYTGTSERGEVKDV